MHESVPERNQPFEALTSREFEILSLLAEGLSDREIADRLTVAYTTVKWYNRQIFNKLGVENRREAIQQAKKLQLLDSDAAPVTPKHGLPAQTTRFVGREQELRDLDELLRGGQARLVTILGSGGMGKTRLALAAAEAARLHFANGLYFVPLAPISSTEQIISSIAEYAGFPFSSDSRTPKQQLIDFFRDKAVLLVLDNFEHLLDGTLLVSDILQAAPGMAVLVTSRERLNLSGETVYTLGGMTYPEDAAPADTLAYSAVALFEQSARRIHPNFVLSAEMDNVIRVCQLVQGMPLAIELAAGWAGTLSTIEIVEEISRSLDFLKTTMRDMPERLRSIRAVFESTWTRLDEREQAAFRKLSVFQGGCTREAAEVVAGTNLAILTGLVNKALLWRVPDSGRYAVHELLRQYAEQELEAVGEAEAARDGHSHYYLSVLQQRRPDLEGSQQLEALREIENDIENIRVAWLWTGQQSNFEALGNSIHILWLYHLIRGGNIEGMSIFAQAADVVQMAAPGDERNTIFGSLLAHKAFFCSELYIKRDEAAALLEQSHALLQYTDSPEAHAFLAFTMGRVASIWKTAAEAQPLLEIALGLYREIGDRWSEAMVLMRLGRNSLALFGSSEGLNLQRVKAYLEEALKIQEELGDIFLRAQILSNLGLAIANSGQLEAGTPLILAGLQLHKQLGNRLKVAADVNVMGLLVYNQGNIVQAQAYLRESLMLSREAGDLTGAGLALTNLAAMMLRVGDFTQARADADDAVTTLGRSGNARKIMQAFQVVGEVAWAQGNYEEAEVNIKRALELSKDEANPDYRLVEMLLLAVIALAKGNLPEAHEYLEQVMRAAPRLDYPLTLNDCRVHLGRLAYMEGDFAGAKGYLEASLAYFQSEDVRHLLDVTDISERLIRLFRLIGDVARAEGNLIAARTHLHNALVVAQEAFFLRPSILNIIASAAELLRAEALYEHAAELAAFVREHDSVYAVDKERAAGLLDVLQAEMPMRVFAAAVERGKALELEVIVAELLAETAA